MDPAEPPELLHRRDCDELNAGVAALLDERLAEDGVGVGGHIDRGSYTPGLQRFAKLLRTDHLSVAMSTVPASRHLHGKYAQNAADPRKYGL